MNYLWIGGKSVNVTSHKKSPRYPIMDFKWIHLALQEFDESVQVKSVEMMH